MATRRSKRINGEKLSERVEDIEAEARHQALREQQPVLMLGTESKDTACGFNLLDLVPELRERVYYFALQPDTPLQLASRGSKLKTPPLTLVSKQVRAEVLPIFFSKCDFVADVYSNYSHMGLFETKPMPALKSHAMKRAEYWHRMAGSMGFINSPNSPRALIAGLEKTEGFIAAFRNINFGILTCDVDTGISEDYVHTGEMERSVMWLRVPTATKLRPVVSYEDPHRVFVPPRYLERIRERAKAKAEQIAAERQVFVGFTLEDLETITAQFKCWPEQVV
ncbi:hypothetical protein LTR56_009243 [Elasticomyces elasticus]|nr:hypothetical protein LTR56_009243 [Elasticomyces elasticus]KAK3664775.1 hypothetical protein LTR22_004363 [Elasticomyces elasticus]KAK4928585.1 hypothetical protein LTR49_004706 [Elasticomyces elasticus]KAK5765153.1 hypothetical protein LTS12_004665 [Elasticomyces elasticus]